MSDFMVITIKNVTKNIGNNCILRDVNLELCNGQVYALRGPNGSGKTMLMRLIAGLILPTFGFVSIDDKVLGRDIDFPESIGLLVENPAFLPGYTGFQNLSFLASIQGKAGDTQIKDALLRVGLNPDDRRKYRKYSLGMKQRLGVAAAIMEKPDIILLDEPTNALDDSGVAQIGKILEEEKTRGALILLASHDSAFMNCFADEIYAVNEGRITKKVKG